MNSDQKLQNIYYPVPKNLSLSKTEKKPLDKDLVKEIIQSTVKGAYKLKDPNAWDFNGNSIKPSAVATQEQQIFQANRIKNGAEFRVNTSDQEYPLVKRLSKGTFIVAPENFWRPNSQ